MVLEIVLDVCMVMLLALGVGSGLATTCTLYPLVRMGFLLLVSCLLLLFLLGGQFLGWVGLE